MGCDIHAAIERREDYEDTDGTVFMSRWLNAGDPDIGRNYEMFAVMANVRNSDDILPISEPRGLPGADDDWDNQPSEMFQALRAEWNADGHSDSWLTLAEIKAYDTSTVVDDPRVITETDEVGAITAVARASTGPTLGVVGERRIFTWPGRAETTTDWDLLIERMEAVKREGDDDERVRLVFFFDN